MFLLYFQWNYHVFYKKKFDHFIIFFCISVMLRIMYCFLQIGLIIFPNASLFLYFTAYIAYSQE